jgi:Coatomer (COPI) alpha subunit C-terminus
VKAMYRSVTEGKFSEALKQVNTLLAVIPLTVVDTRREVDELKELISIAKYAISLSSCVFSPWVRVHLHCQVCHIVVVVCFVPLGRGPSPLPSAPLVCGFGNEPS